MKSQRETVHAINNFWRTQLLSWTLRPSMGGSRGCSETLMSC